MTNLNNIYHKGKNRSGEWGKHLRPFLKRLGNKKFRKDAQSMDQEYFRPLRKRRKGQIRIRIKITMRGYGDKSITYYKTYKSLKSAKSAIQGTRILRYHVEKIEGENSEVIEKLLRC